jgi:hypothetical protein
MPLLLAALVFRVLVPPGFMPGGTGSMSRQASMCATTPGKSETIEVPASGRAHCEHCLAPQLGAPLAQFALEPPLPAAAGILTAGVSQLDSHGLRRAQSARAPPQA